MLARRIEKMELVLKGLETKSVKGLRMIAKERNMTGLSKMNKEQLRMIVEKSIKAEITELEQEIEEARKGLKITLNSRRGNDDVVVKNIQKDVMSHLYKSFPVIKRIDWDEKGNASVSYQVCGMMPLLDECEIDTKVRKDIQVGITDDNENIISNLKVTTGPNEIYRLYTESIVLCVYKGSEKLYDTHRINGISQAESGLNNRLVPFITSASMEKHSSVFFTSYDSKVAYNKINRLTGGVLEDRVDALGEKASYDDIAKVASRNSLCATTPSIWSEKGKTNSFFYYAGEVQVTADGCKLIDDCNHRDGYLVWKDDFAALMISDIVGYEVTSSQVRKASIQGRVRTAAGKGHGRCYDYNQFAKAMKYLWTDHPELCHAFVNGEEVRITKDNIRELARKMDILADKDVFKAFNFKTFSGSKRMLEVGIVNMSNRVAGHMGNQFIYKISGRYPEETAMYIKALAARQAYEANETSTSVKFNKKSATLSGSAYENCMALNPERAMSDRFLTNYKIKGLVKNLSRAVAEIKYDINSDYLRMTPDETLLNNGEEVLTSREVTFKGHDGKEYTVMAVEMYSEAFNKDYHELKALLDNTDMTKEAKMEVLNNFQICVALKSPSQGDEEYEVAYFLTLEEMLNKNVTPEYKQYIRETPANTVIWPADNTLKHQLAGSDFDGDDSTVIKSEITVLDDNTVVNSLVYNGNRVADYVELCVRKRFENDNKGTVAIIKYQSKESLKDLF